MRAATARICHALPDTLAHPLPDGLPAPIVEAVGAGEDPGVDLHACDPVIDAVEDRRSCLDGADLGRRDPDV